MQRFFADVHAYLEDMLDRWRRCGIREREEVECRASDPGHEEGEGVRLEQEVIRVVGSSAWFVRVEI